MFLSGCGYFGAAQHEFADALGMPLGVSESQRRAPGPAEDHPAVDAQMLTQAFDVVDQMPGGVVDEVGVWRRASC